MGFGQRIKKAIGALTKKSLTVEEYTRNSRFLQSLYTAFGTGVQILSEQNLQQYIRSGYQTNPDLYSVSNWVSEQAANIPLVVQQRKGEEWGAVPEHDLQKLIDRPNKYQSGLEQRHQMYSFYLITGNGLIYAPRIGPESPNEGQTQEMWVMPSQMTEIISGGWMSPVESYRIIFSGTQDKKLPFKDVMHLRTPNLSFGHGQEFWGMSPLRAGLLSLNRSNSNYVAADTSFKNLGAAGIISEKMPDYPNMNEELQSDKEEEWIEKYNGPIKKGRMMFTNADIDYIKLGLSPVDLNLIADKRATLRDFCSIYKVSSIIFNDNENSSFNNVLEAKKSAYNDAVLPLVNRHIDELTQWLLPSYGDDLRIIADTSSVAVLQTDKKEQSDRINTDVNNGIKTRDEGRVEMGLAATGLPEMNIHTVGFSTIPLSDITFTSTGDEAEKALKAMGVKHYLDK